MGCGSSNSNKLRVLTSMIRVDSRPTNIEIVDEMLSQYSEPLLTLTLTSVRLRGAIKRFNYETSSKITEDSIDIAIRNMLSCFSLACKGNWEEINLNSSYEAPYISLDRSQLSPEFKIIIEAWEVLVGELQQLKGIINSLKHSVESMRSEVDGLQGRVDAALMHTALSSKETNRVKKAVDRKIHSMKAASENVKTLEELMKKISEEASRIPVLMNDNEILETARNFEGNSSQFLKQFKSLK
jgi:hypothetical protein